MNDLKFATPQACGIFYHACGPLQLQPALVAMRVQQEPGGPFDEAEVCSKV